MDTCLELLSFKLKQYLYCVSIVAICQKFLNDNIPSFTHYLNDIVTNFLHICKIFNVDFKTDPSR